MRLGALGAALAAVCLAGCTKAKIEPSTPGLLLKGTVGAPEPLREQISIGSSPAVRARARVTERWIQVEPKELSLPGTLEVLVDATELSSGTHVTTVTVESPNAEKPAQFKVEVRLEKGSLGFDRPVVRMTANLPRAHSPVTVPLKTSPAGHRFPWRVRVNEPWLSVTPESGRGPTDLTVHARLKEFGVGEFKDTIIVESEDATNPARLQVIATLKPGIAAIPESPEVEMVLGSPQSTRGHFRLDISGGEKVPFKCSWREKWLKLTPSSGMLPADLTFEVDPSKLEAGEHRADILVEAEPADPIAVHVIARVKPAQLQTDLKPLKYSSVIGQNKVHQVAGFIRAGIGGTGSIPISVGTSGDWIEVSMERDRTPAEFNVRIETTGMKSGVHEGTIMFTSPDAAEPIQIPVTFTVSKCRLIVPEKITLKAEAGDKPPEATIPVKTDSGLQVDFTAEASEGFEVQTTGSSVKVRLIDTNRTAGFVSGTVTFKSPDAENEAVCNVNVRIRPRVRLLPDSLAGDCEVGSKSPVVVETSIGPVGLPKLGFKCRASDDWVRPAVEQGSMPTRLRIELDPDGRPPGVYRSDVVIETAQTLPVRIPVELTIRKVGIGLSRQELHLESTAGSYIPLRETVKVRGAERIQYAVRASVDWIDLTRRGHDIELTIDPSRLGKGTHRGRVEVTSDMAAAPVHLAVVLTLKKVALKVPGSIELIGTDSGKEIGWYIRLQTAPAHHNVAWKASANGVEIRPSSGRGPAEVLIVASGTAPGERTIPVEFTSEDAEPARCNVRLSLYKAGSEEALIHPGHHALVREYQKWSRILVGAMGRVPSGDLVKPKNALGELRAAGGRFAQAVGAYETAVEEINGARARVEHLRSLRHRVENYTDEANKILDQAKGERITLPAEPRWKETRLDVRKGDLLVVTARGQWTGSPEWPMKGPDGEPVGGNGKYCLDPTLPFFSLLGTFGTGAPFAIGGGLSLFVTEDRSGPLRLRPNYLQGEHRGELVVEVIRIRLPWYARQLFTESLGQFESQREQLDRSIRDVRRRHEAGEITEAERLAREQDLPGNYPTVQAARARGVARWRREEVEEALRRKLSEGP